MESLIEFSAPETYEASVVQADTVSGTTAGTALSLLLSEPLVLEGANSALSNARVLSLRAAVKAEDHVSVLGYIVSVQGSIQKSEGARAVVLADLGNATKVVEFPFGDPPPLEIPEGGLSLDEEQELDNEVHDDLNQEFVFDVFSLEQRPVRDNNPRMFHALPPFTICLTLHATRRTPQDYAVLMIESIDIRAVPDPMDHLDG
jgi:hypothetical protein